MMMEDEGVALGVAPKDLRFLLTSKSAVVPVLKNAFMH